MKHNYIHKNGHVAGKLVYLFSMIISKHSKRNIQCRFLCDLRENENETKDGIYNNLAGRGNVQNTFFLSYYLDFLQNITGNE